MCVGVVYLNYPLRDDFGNVKIIFVVF